MGKLRSELLALMERRDQREAKLANDLIAYINTLPRAEMQTLTSGVQPEVLEAMEALVYGILKQFGVKEGDRIVLESSDAMKKLLLWQLAIGYNLRELEVRTCSLLLLVLIYLVFPFFCRQILLHLPCSFPSLLVDARIILLEKS